MTISRYTTRFRLKINSFSGKMMARCHIILINRTLSRCHAFALVDNQSFAAIQFVCLAYTTAILDFLIIGIRTLIQCRIYFDQDCRFDLACVIDP